MAFCSRCGGPDPVLVGVQNPGGRPGIPGPGSKPVFGPCPCLTVALPKPSLRPITEAEYPLTEAELARAAEREAERERIAAVEVWRMNHTPQVFKLLAAQLACGGVRPITMEYTMLAKAGTVARKPWRVNQAAWDAQNAPKYSLHAGPLVFSAATPYADSPYGIRSDGTVLKRGLPRLGPPVPVVFQGPELAADLKAIIKGLEWLGRKHSVSLRVPDGPEDL
jgi:hypothetical protein